MLRYVLIFLGFFVLLSVSYGQRQTEIESLLSQLKYAQRDTTMLKLLIHISNKYLSEPPDYVKALPICEQSLELANELKDNRRIAMLSENIASCQEYFGDFSNSLKNYLNAIQFWDSKGDNERVAGLYIRIASFHKDDYEKSLAYYREALKYTERKGNPSDIAKVLWSMNSTYFIECKKAVSY